MSTIKNWQIQSLFRAHLLTVSGIPADKAWENKGFEPTADTPWVRETHLPGDELPVANNRVEQVGIMQYDFFYPAGSGPSKAKQAADTAKKAFKIGTALGDFVRVESATVSRGSNEAPWYSQILRINYTAFGQINP